jgi:glycosyltransferase involved in cell wall biosynthesis
VLFAGLLTYEPNIDAARFLVTDVLPRLRRHHPDAEVRLVGTYDRRVTDLAGRRGVTLAGGVPDMTPELARADVAAVPIRFGGGTRVKILEAFAHGIPVVSTLAGAEGLDVIAGEHLVIADDAQAFADACARALDGDVRHGLRAAGRQLWYDRYRPAALSASVAEVVQDAWADSTPPPSHG